MFLSLGCWFSGFQGFLDFLVMIPGFLGCWVEVVVSCIVFVFADCVGGCALGLCGVGVMPNSEILLFGLIVFASRFGFVLTGLLYVVSGVMI